jgi:hypothetical protein
MKTLDERLEQIAETGRMPQQNRHGLKNAKSALHPQLLRTLPRRGEHPGTLWRVPPHCEGI